MNLAPMGYLRNQELLERIGLLIKQIRIEQRITQEDFYNDTNIHIGRIETGKANMTISTLEAVCKYFKTDLKTFFSKLN